MYIQTRNVEGEITSGEKEGGGVLVGKDGG